MLRRLLLLSFLLFLPMLCWAQIDTLVSPGELSSAHQKFSGVKNCNVCHGADKNVLEVKCLECHKDLQTRIAGGKGFHADKKTGCMKCHTEHLGKDYDIRQLDLKTFRHDQTGYKMEGMHARIKECSACHKSRSFLGLNPDCKTCHKDPHQGRLQNCETCHSAQRPMKQISFDHSTTKFALDGAHQNVACAKCHKNEVYQGTPYANCTSCHSDPHKGSLGATCVNCHTTDAWKKVDIQHKTFPLEGKHASISCAKCHVNGQWKLVNFAKCSDCHKDPHLGQFPQACETCHTVQGFKPAKFSHDYFKLEQSHAIPCAKCHKLEKANFPAGRGEAVRYKPIPADCVSCHKDVHSGQFGNRCENCHTIASFKLKSFDHSKTRFPLDKDHIQVECAKCHKQDPKTKTVLYKPISPNCDTCHKDPHLGQLGSTCSQCHVPGQLLFQHTSSAFQMTGKHIGIPCEKCHKKETGKFPSGTGDAVRYKGIAHTCATCHTDFHRGQFKKDCAACHTTTGFKPSTFEHATSLFPLTGAHGDLACEKCHKSESFPEPAPPVNLIRYSLSQKCGTCHRDPHETKFGDNCVRCHNTLEWKTVNRGFHKKGVFPLEGKHLDTKCESCHWNGAIQGTPTRCYDCHWIRRQDDLYRTKLGTDCENCHKPESWTSVRFDHLVASGVQLGPAHRTLGCDSCHANQNFQTATECFACHREDYFQTTSPNHIAASFPTTCDQCHFPSAGTWEASFNHQPIFPLAGRHATVDCSACHRDNVYTGTPRDCVGCHRSDYDRTKDPNHKAAGFPLNCDSCHAYTDPDWERANFNHNQFFRLVGNHATASCDACHINNVYKGTPRDCYPCHKQEYNQTTNPNHKSAGFSTNCDSCHNATDTNFEQGKFDHNQVFPLAGKHKALACEECHKNGVYTGTPRECYGCHRADYEQTTNPNHRTANFPTNCEVCHKATDANWNQAVFDHNRIFRLQGKHATLPCNSCHKNNVYTGTPRDCFGCHKSDYDATRNPNHQAAGFPTNCENCHRASDSTWAQGRFDHSVFPITSGKHAGFACADCHPNPSNYLVFTCTTSCHPQAQMNSEHRDVGGYTYQSTACLNCHPRGTGGD